MGQNRRRMSYSDRPERDSQERPRRRSASTEQRETSYERREQKPRKSYSGRPERDLRERPRKYSPDSALRTRRSAVSDRIRTKQVKKKDELVRLNKFIANSGICSRREADEYIVAGLVSVNGQVITELGTKVRKDDDVRFNKERLKGENKAYVLLNKPKDYITTTDDPHAKKTVMELIDGACKERVYPVGRLDRNSTGVLLFTNDGDLAKQLTHPSYNKLKVYQVRLDRNIAKADVKALVEGVELDDGQAAADSVHVSETNKAEIGIEIHSGRNRVFPAMLGLSLALHGFVFFGWTGSNPSTPLPKPENQPVTKVKLTRMVKTPPQSVPVPVQRQEQKVIEKKPVETPPEPVPQQEMEAISEVQEGDDHITQETEGGEGETIASPEYSETDDNREYEELLAYISGLIRQNLLYPQMARRRNIEGVVGVHFEIGIDGGLVSVRVNHSSGSSILDRAAVSLIERICPIKSSAVRKSMALNINITYELRE